jgi:hypothetical protein
MIEGLSFKRLANLNLYLFPPSRSVGLSSVTHGSKLFPKELARSVIIIILAVFCYIGVCGCGRPISRFPFDEPDPVLNSQMDVEALRNTLGNPLIVSRYWGVELFREDRSQRAIDIILFIPMMISKDDIYRYTLISYAKDQIAEAIVTGIHRSSSKWTTPLQNDHLKVHLQAGNLTFVSEYYDGYENLMVTPARRDVYLERAHFSSQCTAVIGCGPQEECTNTLSVDEGPSLPLPCRLGVSKKSMYDTVAALRLAPGKHTIKTWAGPFSREQTITFACREGEILYVVIGVDLSAEKKYSWWVGGNVPMPKIDLLKDMPEFFVDRPLLLYRGQWLMDPEPKN